VLEAELTRMGWWSCDLVAGSWEGWKGKMGTEGGHEGLKKQGRRRGRIRAVGVEDHHL
jgi:hypothetical protein